MDVRDERLSNNIQPLREEPTEEDAKSLKSFSGNSLSVWVERQFGVNINTKIWRNISIIKMKSIK